MSKDSSSASTGGDSTGVVKTAPRKKSAATEVAKAAQNPTDQEDGAPERVAGTSRLGGIRIPQFIGIGVSAVVIFYAGQFASSLLLLIVFSGLLGRNPEQISDTFTSDAYLANAGFFTLVSVVMVLLIWVALKLIGSGQKDVLMIRNRPTIRSVLYVVPVYGYYFVASLLVRIVLSETGLVNVSQQQDIGFSVPGTQQGQLLLFFMLAVLPPIWEELLFRGYLYNKMKQYGGVLLAYVGTSMLFGLAHIEGASLNWVAVADTAVFSVFLIHISQKYQSLYPAMLLHSLKNSIAFVVLFLL